MPERRIIGDGGALPGNMGGIGAPGSPGAPGTMDGGYAANGGGMFGGPAQNSAGGGIPYQTPWQGGPDSPSAVNSGQQQIRSTGGGVATQQNRLVLPYGQVRVLGQTFRPFVPSGNGGTAWLAWGAGPIEEVTSLVEGDGSWSKSDFLGTFDNGGTPLGLDPSNPLALMPYVAGSIVVAADDTTIALGEVNGNIKGRKCYDPRENRFIHSSDFSGTYWSSNYAGPDAGTPTPGQADPWGTTSATKLHFPAGAANDYFRTYTVATTSGKKRTVELWMKSTGGTVNAFLECVNVLTGSAVETKKKELRLTNRWRKVKVTLHATTTGDQISLAMSFPAAAVAPEILVANAGLSLKGFSGGTTFTTATEVVPVFAYTENLALVALDVICSCVDAGNVEGKLYPLAGNPFGLDDFNPRHVDVESFGEAARVAPNVAIVFSDKLSLDQALSRLRMAGRADIYFYRGRLRIDIDAIHTEDPEIVFASNQRHDPLHPNNCKNLEVSHVPAVDAPTRVTVTYYDRNANWTQNTVASEDPGIQAGTVAMREAAYNIDGVATALDAMTAASWIRRVPLYSMRIRFNCSPVGILLRRYQLIRVMAQQTVTQSDGTTFEEAFDKRFLVTNFERMTDGTFSCAAREYNDDIYTVDPNADGDPTTPIDHPFHVPPVVRPIITYDTATGKFTLCYDPARNYVDREYTSASWAHANVGAGWDGTKINDGLFVDVAADFTPAADSVIRLDAGSDKVFGALKGSLSVDSIPAGWLVETSPDDASWTPVVNPFKRTTDDLSPGFLHEWDLPTAARYIRVRKGSSVAGTENITELQFREFTGLYDQQHGIQLRKLDGTAAMPEIVGSISARTCIDVTGLATLGGDNKLTVDILVHQVGGRGGVGCESIGVRASCVSQTAPPSDIPLPVRMLAIDHATGKATWQLGCLVTEPVYPGSNWAVANAASYDADKIDDGDFSATAIDCNAAGATTVTLTPAAAEAFCGVRVWFPAATPFFVGRHTVGTPGGFGYATRVPDGAAGTGLMEQWIAEYTTDGGTTWVAPPQTKKTNSTAVNYYPRAASQNYPAQGGVCYDEYLITGTILTLEWDPDLYYTTRTKWRLRQTTTDAIALTIKEIHWQKFDRWNEGVHSFGIYAGLVTGSAGVTQTTDGGVITPTGRQPVALGALLAKPIATTVKYEFTSSSFASGVVRRTNWPGPFHGDVGGSNGSTVDGYLFEVTVITFGEPLIGTKLVESVVRFAWDYAWSTDLGQSE